VPEGGDPLLVKVVEHDAANGPYLSANGTKVQKAAKDSSRCKNAGS